MKPNYFDIQNAHTVHQTYITWPNSKYITVDICTDKLLLVDRLNRTQEFWKDPRNLLNEKGWFYLYSTGNNSPVRRYTTPPQPITREPRPEYILSDAHLLKIATRSLGNRNFEVLSTTYKTSEMEEL